MGHSSCLIVSVIIQNLYSEKNYILCSLDPFEPILEHIAKSAKMVKIIHKNYDWNFKRARLPRPSASKSGSAKY